MSARPSRRRDAGESLVELLVAVVVLGITAVAIVGAIGVSIMMSDIHRKQANAGSAVRDYAEQIESYVASGNYLSCGSASTYSAAKVGYSVPTGYTASVTSMGYWEDLTTTPSQATRGFYSTCPTKTNGVSGDSGLQQLGLKVSSADGRAAETLTIVIRQPCKDLSCH